MNASAAFRQEDQKETEGRHGVQRQTRRTTENQAESLFLDNLDDNPSQGTKDNKGFRQDIYKAPRKSRSRVNSSHIRYWEVDGTKSPSPAPDKDVILPRTHNHPSSKAWVRVTLAVPPSRLRVPYL